MCHLASHIPATVDVDCLTCQIARRWSSKKSDELGDFPRLPDAPDRDRHALETLWQRAVPCRLDTSGRNAIHRHPLLRQLRGKSAGQPRHASFCGGDVRASGHAGMPCHATEIYDCSLIASHELRKRGLTAKEGCIENARHDGAPFADADLSDAGVEAQRRVVYENVDLAEFTDAGPDGPSGRFGVLAGLPLPSERIL